MGSNAPGASLVWLMLVLAGCTGETMSNGHSPRAESVRPGRPDVPPEHVVGGEPLVRQATLEWR